MGNNYQGQWIPENLQCKNLYQSLTRKYHSLNKNLSEGLSWQKSRQISEDFYNIQLSNHNTIWRCIVCIENAHYGYMAWWISKSNRNSVY